jgi:hypothetical protein
MIQRIQSIFIVLILVITFITFFITYKDANQVIHKISENVLVFSTLIFILLLGFLSFILFTRRRMQIRALLILILCSAIMIFEFYSIIGISQNTILYIFPISLIVFAVLSIFYIKKDIKLVEGADRLR